MNKAKWIVNHVMLVDFVLTMVMNRAGISARKVFTVFKESKHRLHVLKVPMAMHKVTQTNQCVKFARPPSFARDKA